MLGARNIAGLAGRLTAALRVATAAGALALVLVPGEVWSRPSSDLTTSGFDPETVYVDPRGDRYFFDRFQVLINGDWRPCPCAPGTELALLGNGLAPVSLTSDGGRQRLGPVSVTVDGRPALLSSVSPTQINLALPDDATPPVATIRLLHYGREVGRRSVAVAPVGTTTSPSPGDTAVTVTPDTLEMHAAGDSGPAVHLLTTPLSFRASFTVTVGGEASGRPFEAMLWNPRNFAALSVIFGPTPDHRVEAVGSENRGQVTSRGDLGVYRPGRPYRVEVAVDRGRGAELRVAPVGAPTRGRKVSFVAADAPAFFEAFRPTLTLLSRSAEGGQTATVADYRLELPPDRLITVRTGDEKVLPLALALLILSAALHVPLLVRGSMRAGALRRLPTAGAGRWLRRWWWTVAPALAFAGGVGLLMTMGSHPFDMGSQKVWTYLLLRDGFGDLYYRAQTVPLARVWDGMPFHEAVYPYGVVMSYFFYAVGWVHRALGGSVSPDSAGLEVTIKAANLMAALAVAGVLLALVRGLGARGRPSLAAPLVFLAGPALLFDVAVWGETEPIALLLLMGSLLAAQRSAARWAWCLLALAALSKQTVVLPAFLAAIYYLRLFPLRRNLQGWSVAAPLTLLASLPYLASGYPPSIAVDPIIGSMSIFGGSQMERAFQTVSFDSYNLWSLITLVRDGAHGVSRLGLSDQTSLGPLTYHQAGIAAFVAVVAALTLFLATSRRVKKAPEVVFLLLAFATLAQIFLPTRSIARYLVFPMVIALVPAGAGRPKAMWFVVGALSLTALAGMYGSVATGLDSRAFLDSPMAPANNPVSALALSVFRSDAAITVGALLNLAALFTLGATLWLPPGAAAGVRRWLSVRRRSGLPRLAAETFVD